MVGTKCILNITEIDLLTFLWECVWLVLGLFYQHPDRNLGDP